MRGNRVTRIPLAECVSKTREINTFLEAHNYKRALELRGQELTHVEPVGNYALNLTWQDGHNTGIYPFRQLRALCPCAECGGARFRPEVLEIRCRGLSIADALDDFFALVYRSGILGVARIVGWVDRYIVDGVLNVLSAWTLTLGDRLRRIQSGQAQDYVYGIALGVLLLMVWMRWPR